MMTILTRLCAALLLTAGLPLIAGAAEAAPAVPPAVQQMVDQFAAAFNARDAKALAALWTTDAQHIDMTGETCEGRAAIEASYVKSFARSPDGKLTVTVMSIRPVGEKVMLLDVVPTVAPAAAGVPAEIRTSLVLVDENGSWLIQNARDTAALAGCSKQLEPVAWLEGQWRGVTDSPDKIALRMDCRWTGNKSFLLRTYTVTRNGVARHGTEVIGWDPKTKSIRSWVFDSTGGFGERQWKRDDAGWLLTLTGTSAEGVTVEDVDRLEVVNADRLWYDDIEHKRDGTIQPDLPPLEMQRVQSSVAPAAGTAEPILPESPAKN